MAEQSEQGGNPVLRFFGLETASRALETCSWVLPYLGAFLFVLFILSLLIQRFFPLPIWVHVLAMVLAAVNCFFFLARIRIMSLHDESEEQQGNGDDGKSDMEKG